MKEYLTFLNEGGRLRKKELTQLISHRTPKEEEFLFSLARKKREAVYGKDVYIRGLIEVSSYCRKNCYYCGIRRENKKASRYRLSAEEILECCQLGYELGFRTFVLQGGEDSFFSTKRVTFLIKEIKRRYPEAAVTLSLGERTAEDYEAFQRAGADRYLLRHETANATHFAKLHPEESTSAQRRKHLYTLKELGFQVGAGFMVGSPYQTPEHLAEDLLFLYALQPDMIGIGPYIVHKDTPFGTRPSGSVEDTLFLLGLLRLLLPHTLLPATTALATLDPMGTEKGLWAGANVIMPNLSPPIARKQYNLYENKKNTGTESAEALEMLKEKVKTAGYHIAVHRGDVILPEENKQNLTGKELS